MPTVKLGEAEIYIRGARQRSPADDLRPGRLRVQRAPRVRARLYDPDAGSAGRRPAAPAYVGEEVAKIAPNIEVMREWKGSPHLAEAISRVSAFLERHTPPDRTRRAA